MIKLVMPIKPTPFSWRIVRNGAFHRLANTKTYKEYREEIESFIRLHLAECFFGSNIPLKLNCELIFKIPEYCTKKEVARRLAQGHIIKPDLTNLIKAIEDSLKGVYFKDDSQIVEHRTKKLWGNENLITVEIKPVDIKD